MNALDIFICSGLLQKCFIFTFTVYSDLFTEGIFICVDNIEEYSFSVFIIGNYKNIVRIVKIVFSRDKPVTDMGKSLDHRVEAHSPNEVTALVSFPSCLEWKICPFWFLNSEKLKVIFWYSYSSWNLVSFNLLSSNNLLFIVFKIVPVVWINVGFLLLKGRALFRAPAEQAASCLLSLWGRSFVRRGDAPVPPKAHGDFVECAWWKCLWLQWARV